MWIRALLLVLSLFTVTRAQWGWKMPLDEMSVDLNGDINEAVRLHEDADFVTSIPYYLRALRR